MDHPEVRVCRSMFCELRPCNVFLMHDTPADQCKCKTHENVFLKLKALKVSYSSDWWKTILCNSQMNSPCWEGKCEVCKNGSMFHEQVKLEREKPVSWYVWEAPDKDLSKRIRKVLHEGCVGELTELVLSDFEKMREHVNIKRIQAQAFQLDQSDPRKRILQIDFAMSYSSEYQNEIQSGLWSRASVTLFTAAVIQGGTCKTYLICSDSSNKDKDTVATFLFKLYDIMELNELNLEPEVDIIWSDGPSSEFKNRYMVKLLQVLATRYGKPFQWKYFATSHGKGIVDGIGGAAKSLVRNRIMSQSEKPVLVQNHVDFATVAATAMPKTNILHVSQAEITAMMSGMCIWEEVPPVPGIQQVHVINCSKEGEIIGLMKTAKTQSFMAASVSMPAEGGSNSVQYVPGEWVIVTYDRVNYPGEVISVQPQEIEVSTMVRSGSYWKWPVQNDQIFYEIVDIVRKVSPPTPAGSRGQFSFDSI